MSGLQKSKARPPKLSVVVWVPFVLGLLLAVGIVTKLYDVSERDSTMRFLSSSPLGGARSSVVYSAKQDGQRVPNIPTGPKDKLYMQHEFLDVDYRLVLDTGTGYTNFTGGSFPSDYQNWATQALRYRNGWIQRVRHFRRFLFDEGKSNVDPHVDLKDAEYRKAVLPRAPQSENGDYESARSRVVPDLDTFIPNDDPKEGVERFAYCMKNPHDCGSVDSPVIVDVSLVLPLNILRVNNSYTTLESIRQLISFPREIVFVISGTTLTSEVSQTFAFLTILKEFYAPQFPTGVQLKVYTAKTLYKPGESRWFGFNQTTLPVVMQFDGDDYMHPQMFQIIDTVFKQRPELDYGLFHYEEGAIEGEYVGDALYKPILRHLRMRHFTHEDIHNIAGYSSREYDAVRRSVPTWNKKWWLGNTDAEPNWGGEEQRWWDPGCHNGWVAYRRRVMESITPPVDLFGGEDAIYNYRVVRSGFNYKCIDAIIGVYLKCFCTGDQALWTKSDLDLKIGETNQIVPQAVNAVSDTVGIAQQTQKHDALPEISVLKPLADYVKADEGLIGQQLDDVDAVVNRADDKALDQTEAEPKKLEAQTDLGKAEGAGDANEQGNNEEVHNEGDGDNQEVNEGVQDNAVQPDVVDSRRRLEGNVEDRSAAAT